jgi:hypothetical protein
MSLLAALAACALSASQADSVLVVSYQSLGVDAAAVAKLGEGFRAGSNKPPLQALGAEESDKAGRAAVMCGEDAACLSTVGQRSAAKYVLAYGVGKVGSSLLVSAIFIDVAAGKEITRASKRVLEVTPDWALITRELSDLVVKPPAEPLVVQVPVPVRVEVPAAQHRWRTPAFVAVGLGAAFGVVATILGAVAWSNYSQLTMAGAAGDAGQYHMLAQNQRGWNGAADVFLIATVLGFAAATVFFIIDRRDVEPPTFETSPVAPGVPSW